MSRLSLYVLQGLAKKKEDNETLFTDCRTPLFNTLHKLASNDKNAEHKGAFL